jgi:hypothetical protein
VWAGTGCGPPNGGEQARGVPRLPVEDSEKVGGRVDRELGRELEQVPIPGHERGALVCGERDQVVVSGILGGPRRRLVGSGTIVALGSRTARNG